LPRKKKGLFKPCCCKLYNLVLYINGQETKLKIKVFLFWFSFEREREQERWRVDCVWIRKRVRVGDYMEERGGGGWGGGGRV